jgi:hypothetical protein
MSGLECSSGFTHRMPLMGNRLCTLAVADERRVGSPHQENSCMAWHVVDLW